MLLEFKKQDQNGYRLRDKATTVISENDIPYVFRGSRETDQTIADITETTVQFSIDYDPYQLYDKPSYSFVAPRAGYYLYIVSLSYEPNSSGVRRVTVYKNGLTSIGEQEYVATSGSFNACIQKTDIVYLEKGATIQIKTYQSSGGNLDLDGSADRDLCTFTVALVLSHLGIERELTNLKSVISNLTSLSNTDFIGNINTLTERVKTLEDKLLKKN